MSYKKLKKSSRDLLRNVNKAFDSKMFRVSVFIISALILFAAAIFYGYKSAQIHMSNSDQLIDIFMFSDAEAFRESVFPSSHSFFFKWPIFAIASQFTSYEMFIILTIVITVITVFFMALASYFISGKSLKITAISCLSIAITMLLTPIQTEPGHPLPVGIGMITTRNLEFIVFAAILYLMTKTEKIKSWKFWLGAVLLAVIGASDALFLETAMLATLIFGIFIYIRDRSKKIEKRAVLPFISSIIAFLLAKITIFLISYFNITSFTASHGLKTADSIQQIFDQFLNSIQAIFINFGAPVFGVSGKKISVYFISFAIMCFACFAIFYVIKHWWKKTKKDESKLNFLFLYILATFAAFFAFICTSHGELENARYVQIVWFAGIFSLSYFMTKINKKIIPWTIIFLIFASPVIFLASKIVINNYEKTTEMEYHLPSSRVVDILNKEKIDVLVGQFWRVIPAKVEKPELVTVGLDGKCNLPSGGGKFSKAWISRGEYSRSALLLNQTGISPDNEPYFISECSESGIREIYGKPVKSMTLQEEPEGPLMKIYLYNYDIREKIKIQ